MFDRGTFTEACHQALLERSPQLAMKEVVARAVSAPKELLRALTPTQGGIDPIHRSADLTILHVTWAPGMVLYPHDHRMPAIIGLYGGQEDNSFYRRSPEGLRLVNGQSLVEGETIVLGRDVIHSVANPRSSLACALHVYLGDFFATPRSEWDPESLDERPYSVEKMLQAFAEANERAGLRAG